MKSVRVLVEVGILVAMAFVLEFAFSFLPAMPQGGRVSLSLLPIIVISWRHGVIPGLIGGFVYSILNLMLDGFVLYHWASLFLDYFFAFSLVGLAGIVKKPLGDKVYVFGLAILIGFVARFVMHLISGAVLFGEWAPAGQNVWVYSLVYNSTYLLPAFILTLIVGIGVYFPLSTLEEETY